MTNPQIDALTGMPVPRRRAVLAAFAAMLAALAAMFAAHTTVAAEPRPSRGGILTFAVDAEPPNYDCHSNFSFVLIHPVIPHYSTLLKFDTANYPQVAGDLAESWNVSPDRLTYTFKLRQNVLFHDGSRLTSADVKASYDRIIHPSQGVLQCDRPTMPQSPGSIRPTRRRWSFICNGPTQPCWPTSPHPGTASTVPQSSKKTLFSLRRIFSGAGRSCSSST
jgi:ABC-type transport system substrate-binding protein